MHYVFDIDGTICTHASSKTKYSEAKPIKDRIHHINKLFDEGFLLLQ